MNLRQHMLTEGINDAGIFKACFLCGSPGSGKSYTYQQIQVGSVSPRIVNTDKFMEHFIQKYSFDQSDTGERHTFTDKSKLLTQKQLALYLNSMVPLALDTTSVNPGSTMRRKGILESIGYDTGMVFVMCSLDTALKRAEGRTRKVDPDYIKDTYKMITELSSYYKTIFNPFLVIDNDDDMLTNDVILTSFKKMSSFYNGPIANPIGKNIVQDMRDKGEKYITQSTMSMSELNSLVDYWYR